MDEVHPDPHDRAIVLSFGRKIAEGTPEGITRDTGVQQAYLGGSEGEG